MIRRIIRKIIAAIRQEIAWYKTCVWLRSRALRLDSAQYMRRSR